MIIETQLKKYIIFAEDSIVDALRKISDNKSRIIFSVTESGVLEGIVTDGDFRRWLVRQNSIDLNQPISSISNKDFKFAFFDAERDSIQAAFSEKIEFIPLLDRNHRLVAIARSRPNGIQLGDFTLNAKSPTFVIAEIGNNHNGSLARAKALVDAAGAAGANCAKFQMRHLPSLYRNGGRAEDTREDLGSQYTLDLLRRYQLSPAALFATFDYCQEKGILPLCTPWDFESLRQLEAYGLSAYKVASADLTNHDLLSALVKTGKPLICSTGMSTETEIKETVALLKQLGGLYVLLHCNSTYPTPFKDVQLNYLERLQEIGDCPVGYSGHERDIYVAIAAVAKGAKVIEKHLTLDKTLEGNDHKVSLLPQEFKNLVTGIRQVEQALGTTEARQISQGERLNREILAKSLITRCDLQPGEVITAEMLAVKSPGQGLQPNRKLELIGLPAKRPLKAGDFFFPSDLLDRSAQPRSYCFKRPWGLPVRYHDFKSILAKSNPTLAEFHLSYKDMDEDISQYFDQPYDLKLVVHSPELFANDHILDLCSEDERYRHQSIEQLQRVIDITRSLKPYFQSERPQIVTNVGGVTAEAPLSVSDRKKRYELLLNSLSALETKGVEIMPQTMPPFPWHFGGQRYHNLFLDCQDIADFCGQQGYRICLDVSHTKLTCNQQQWSFKSFIQQVAPYAAHYHIADAKGVDGEGLQIGKGEIDFFALAEDLNTLNPTASFIPEIWQGHKNGGEGFWQALEQLERWF
ncbi:N-acetylneuraminate synthase family protein [Sphaerothrix gracilis]|uniref:N-acetylneuraminate synthase family protein n=1 Tax=Sphaerothrix gracilis TaxID=3151835 RepID=UPI0031FC109B